jgi:hypothetical protein
MKQPTRIELDLDHHRMMMDFYFKLFNALPARCPNRRLRAQHRFNFHRTRIEELREIRRNQTIAI